MTKPPETSPKAHHICQIYVEKKGRGADLQLGNQFQYSTARDAENRASREFDAETCVGVDAYTVIEDPQSGEVGPPSFLARLGRVPEFEDF